MSCAYECMLLVLHANMCLLLCVICLICAVFVLSCQAKSVDLHMVPDGNSTLVLANRLITTFIPKSHMHVTGALIGAQKWEFKSLIVAMLLLFSQESAQLLPGVTLMDCDKSPKFQF